MCSVFKCLCILHLSLVTVANGVQIENIVKSKHILAFGSPLSLQNANLRASGIFKDFLISLFDLLTKGFPGRKLVRYCRTLSRHLRDMDFKYTRRLSKHLRYLSRMYRDSLKEEIEEYRGQLVEEKPMRKQFLDAMDDVFTLTEKIKFSDYIFDLRDYGNEDILEIDTETRKLLDMIVDSVYKLSKSERKELDRKLKKAIKEYNRE